MLTVKHIRVDGDEEIVTGVRVRAVVGPNASSQIDKVQVDHAGGDHVSLVGGTVFVMNDSGKTVARYDLGASMVPLDRNTRASEPIRVGR